MLGYLKHRVAYRSLVRGSTIPGVPILMYHDIVESPHTTITVPVAGFTRVMTALARAGWRSIPLLAVADALRGRSLGTIRNAFALTFDDGGAGVFRHAFPVLKALGFVATVFVVPQWIGSERSFSPVGRSCVCPDIRSGRRMRRLDYMNWEQLKQLLEAGWEVGSHSWSHADLVRLDDDALLREVLSPKRIVYETLGVDPRWFCYPFGTYDSRVVHCVQRLYEAACTTNKGVCCDTSTLMELPRLSGGASLWGLVARMGMGPTLTAGRLLLCHETVPPVE